MSEAPPSMIPLCKRCHKAPCKWYAITNTFGRHCVECAAAWNARQRKLMRHYKAIGKPVH